MAKMVLTNAFISVAGVDLSDHVSDVTLEVDINAVPVTAMGDGGVVNLMGLESGKIDITFWQDFAAGKVDATLIAIRNGGTAVPIKVAANGTAISATNPSYTYQSVLTSYPPIDGGVGSGMASKVSFVSSGHRDEGDRLMARTPKEAPMAVDLTEARVTLGELAGAFGLTGMVDALVDPAEIAPDWRGAPSVAASYARRIVAAHKAGVKAHEIAQEGYRAYRQDHGFRRAQAIGEARNEGAARIYRRHGPVLSSWGPGGASGLPVTGVGRFGPTVQADALEEADLAGRAAAAAFDHTEPLLENDRWCRENAKWLPVAA